MKKRWKVFWIICAVLTAVGIFLFMAGTVLGGFTLLRGHEDEEILDRWMERLGIYEETGDVWKTEETYAAAEPNGTTVSAYAGISEIEVDAESAGVEIRPCDGEEVIVDISGLREDLQKRVTIREDSGNLEIELKQSEPRNTNNTGWINISVPRSEMLHTLEANVGLGSLEMEGISADEMKVDVGAGMAEVRSASCDFLEADCGTGELIWDGEVTGAADVKCDVGNVVLTLPGQKETYDYEIDCGVGAVVLDGETYSGIREKISEDNGSGCRIEADCGLGRLEINFR